MVEGEGFEPSKAEPSDLQSDPFDRSGTPPTRGWIFSRFHQGLSREFPPVFRGAGSGTRTHDLLITSQLLYQLSYTGLNEKRAALYVFGTRIQWLTA